MNRNYNTQDKRNDVEFFTAYEVERTPAFGMHTLFVVGLQPADNIIDLYDKHRCEHIFFGANHSFHPGNDNDEWEQWEKMIAYFLEHDYLCTLDIPLSEAEQFNESGLCEYNNFIPQIRVAVPYIRLWNYNTMLKVDDKDFNYSNPGVWCHSLHDLMSKKTFTDWRDYSLDTPVNSK